jgi:hypothetical protein
MAAGEGTNTGLRRISLGKTTFAQASTDNFKSSTFYSGAFNTKTLPVDPLVTGFAFIKWISLPSWISSTYDWFSSVTEKNLKSFNGNDDVEISPIGMQIGFTGNESQFAGAMGSKGTGFTMSHNEFSGSPVTEAYNYWVSSVRDPHSGIASYPAEHGVDYCARNHTGELLYVVLKPSAGRVSGDVSIESQIEEATYYTNVMPLKIQRSHLNYSQGTQESPTVEQTFMGDRFFGAGVLEYAASVLSTFESINCLRSENVGNESGNSFMNT